MVTDQRCMDTYTWPFQWPFLNLFGLASGSQRSSSKLLDICCRVIFTHWITYYVSSGILNIVYLLNHKHAKVCTYISKTTLGISFLYNMLPDKFVQYSFPRTLKNFS